MRLNRKNLNLTLYRYEGVSESAVRKPGRKRFFAVAGKYIYVGVFCISQTAVIQRTVVVLPFAEFQHDFCAALAFYSYNFAPGENFAEIVGGSVCYNAFFFIRNIFFCNNRRHFLRIHDYFRVVFLPYGKIPTIVETETFVVPAPAFEFFFHTRVVGFSVENRSGYYRRTPRFPESFCFVGYYSLFAAVCERYIKFRGNFRFSIPAVAGKYADCVFFFGDKWRYVVNIIIHALIVIGNNGVGDCAADLVSVYI